MKRALYLNKFGIMHLGLVELVKHIEKEPDVDEIILGVCSSQFSDKNKSPQKQEIYNCLTSEERIKVMKTALKGVRKPIQYIPIPDLIPIDKSFPENRWIDSVLELVPEFDILYSERELERVCLEKKGKEIRDVPKYVIFSDHCIRDKIARGEIWAPYFTPESAPVLEKLNIEKRYKKLYGALEAPSWAKNIDFEWRTFDRIAQADIDKILSLEWFDEKEAADNYLLSLTRTSINMKINDGEIKVKELLKSVNDIEQWTSFSFKYPVSAEEFKKFGKEKRFPIIPGLEGKLNQGGLLSKIPDFPNPYLMLVPVNKRRLMRVYKKDGIRVGVDINYLNVFGRDHISIGIEGKSQKDAETAIKDLGLRHKPRNYIQFLEQECVKKYGNELFENMRVRIK